MIVPYGMSVMFVECESCEETVEITDGAGETFSCDYCGCQQEVPEPEGACEGLPTREQRTTMNHAVIAMDPGVFTGIACYVPEGYEYGDGSVSDETLFWSCEIPDDPQRVANYIRYYCPAFQTVTERFLISKRTLTTKIFYQSLMLEGWMKVEYPGTVAYTPAQAKNFSTDALLKHLGWYDKTQDGHANDAARHLALHLSKTRDTWMLDQLRSYANADD